MNWMDDFCDSIADDPAFDFISMGLLGLLCGSLIGGVVISIVRWH